MSTVEYWEITCISVMLLATWEFRNLVCQREDNT